MKYTTTAHAHDANDPITQSIHKHDFYTVLLVPRLGLVVTNHVCELYSFDCYYYYYYYYYYYQSLITLGIIIIIIIIAPKVFSYNAGDS